MVNCFLFVIWLVCGSDCFHYVCCIVIFYVVINKIRHGRILFGLLEILTAYKKKKKNQKNYECTYLITEIDLLKGRNYGSFDKLFPFDNRK